jgi:hypothetical protein
MGDSSKLRNAQFIVGVDDVEIPQDCLPYASTAQCVLYLSFVATAEISRFLNKPT